MEKTWKKICYGILFLIICCIGVQAASLYREKENDKLLPTDAKAANYERQNDNLVYPSGEPVGIYIKTKGVLVLGTQEISSGHKGRKNPSAHKLKSGDYLLKMNGEEIHSKKQLQSLLQVNRQKEIVFTILRNGECQEVKIAPVFYPEEKRYAIGAWIRNDTQGIGTVTYLTKQGDFAALGHGINDCDLGVKIEISEGSLYHTDIASIMKGKIKNPGEIIGTIRYVPENYLGVIKKNTVCGIFGTLDSHGESYRNGLPVEVAKREEIKEGPAFIRTSISGESKDYTIEIEKIANNKKDPQKALKLKVTDQELIQLTGGIIQGLSGSPIIQNGKLAGAVTHVFVDSPVMGYGICAETMIKEMNSR